MVGRLKDEGSFCTQMSRIYLSLAVQGCATMITCLHMQLCRWPCTYCGWLEWRGWSCWWAGAQWTPAGEKEATHNFDCDGWTDRQTDRHTDIQTYKQTDRQTDRQTNKQTNRQTGRLTVSIVPRKLPVALMSARLCRNLSMSEEVCSQ